MCKTTRTRLAVLCASLLLAFGISLSVPAAASATAQTCIGATNGYVCTIVYGSGTYVSDVGVSRGKAPTAICNYSAWFFYIPPSGGAYSLGAQSRYGCVFLRAWFTQHVGRSFPRGTLVCAKFYENFWSTLIGQKCVGIS